MMGLGFICCGKGSTYPSPKKVFNNGLHLSIAKVVGIELLWAKDAFVSDTSGKNAGWVVNSDGLIHVRGNVDRNKSAAAS